ncbi:MAG: DUF624 domain-containing protein [Acholeplasmataceae bacterium]|nr:MAG: DUF624 domain-containing protein [Acholeplasmataceae bacterium]
MKDNPVKELYRIVMDVVLLNLLWLLASFLGLLVTAGAATTAMFRVAFQILNRDEPTHVLDTFVKSFKADFWISTWVWLGLVVLGTPLFFAYHLALRDDLLVLLVFSIVGAYQLMMFAIYVFPIIARFKTKGFGQLVKNVLLLANASLWTNIKVLGSLAAVFLLAVFISPMFLLVAIGFYGLLVAFHLAPVLNPYAEPFEDSHEEETML